MEQAQLSGLRRLAEYQQSRRHVFRSEGSLTWYIRTNRRQLVDAGALVLIAGTWHANETAFDSVVIEIGQAAAKRREGSA